MPAQFRAPSKTALLLQGQLLLVGCTFLACLAGIATRPVGFSATVWPANPILIGLLLRKPGCARHPLTWLYLLGAYCLADLLHGSPAAVTLGMNCANLLGVFVGWRYLVAYGSTVLGFRHQRGVLHLLVAGICEALGGAVLGAPLLHWLFGVTPWHSLQLWFSNELFNMLLFLPVVLAAPRGWPWRWKLPQRAQIVRWGTFAPLLALLASEALTYTLTGPGALGLSVPALIWCAMSYGVFPITVLNLLLSLGRLVAAAGAGIQFVPSQLHDAQSFFLGMALMSLAPLAVAIAHSLSAQTLRRLRIAVDHDFLTGVLSRRALMELGQRHWQRARYQGGAMVAVVIDLDHFKRINDAYGHAQGDVVLQQFAALTRRHLRPDDVFGRIGGEEFALLLPGATTEQATVAAERVRVQLAEHRFRVPDGATLQVTCSAGLCAADPVSPDDTLERLLARADRALYQAKEGGRNQLRHYDPLAASQPWEAT